MKTAPLILAILGSALLAGCGGIESARPGGASQPPAHIPPRKIGAAGAQDAVIGRDARGLTALFGRPAQDVREANGRKLQFGNGVCVLDAFLYPKKAGQEPVTTFVDTRRLDGATMDRATCVAALAER